MRYIIIVFSCCFFAACSQEEIIESVVDSTDPAVRAASDIFKVTKIEYPDEGAWSWYDGYRGVDKEGNFYYLGYNDTGMEIRKYDHQKNETAPFSPFELGNSDYGHFCFDDRNNFCYVVHLNGTYALRRISSDGNSIYDQPILLPPMNPEDGYEHHAYRNCGIDAAENGNIFMLFLDDFGNIRLFRLNSTNGVLAEMNVDFTSISEINEFTRLLKASGAIHYIEGAYPADCVKLNTNTGIVEDVEFRFPIRSIWRKTAACTSKSNLYALNGRQIIMLRPNAATDLIVGSIPNRYTDKDGNLIELGEPEELYMNADASIFYVVMDNFFYKLNL